MRRLVASLHDPDGMRLERIEKGRRVHCCVHDGSAGRICRRLDVWVEESQRRRRLGGEDGEEGEELRRVVVGEEGQGEALGVVLVDAATLVSASGCEEAAGRCS